MYYFHTLIFPQMVQNLYSVQTSGFIIGKGKRNKNRRNRLNFPCPISTFLEELCPWRLRQEETFILMYYCSIKGLLQYYSIQDTALKSKRPGVNPGSATCELGDHEQVTQSFCFLIFKMGKRMVSSFTGFLGSV